MYTFIIKDNGTEVEIVITRAMLALASIAAFVYRNDKYYYLTVVLSIILLIAAVFINLLLKAFRISKFVLLTAAAIILLIATRSIAFALILLLYGYFFKFLFQKPVIEVSDKGIMIRKPFSNPVYQWNKFSNIVLKDDLLTLDFKNNKLIQVSIDETKTEVDESSFNNFCKGLI